MTNYRVTDAEKSNNAQINTQITRSQFFSNSMYGIITLEIWYVIRIHFLCMYKISFKSIFILKPEETGKGTI